MFTGTQVAGALGSLGITHVVTVPDSTLGPWASDLAAAGIRVITVCREGETWGTAAGLYLGGARPLVMIQCTGLFESGDALRNVLHDWQLPIPSVIGYRSYLNQSTLPGDTCLTFTEPLLAAWRIDFRLLTEPDQLPELAGHLGRCLAAGKPGAVVIAEGKA